LPDRLERVHHLRAGFLFECCGRSVLLAVRCGLLPCHGEHTADVEPVQRGVLLRVVNNCEHDAGRVPGRVLLPAGLGRRCRMSRRLLWLADWPLGEHVYGRVRGRLLRVCCEHVDDSEPVPGGLLLPRLERHRVSVRQCVPARLELAGDVRTRFLCGGRRELVHAVLAWRVPRAREYSRQHQQVRCGLLLSEF
jgi:hypothetical protein